MVSLMTKTKRMIVDNIFLGFQKSGTKSRGVLHFVPLRRFYAILFVPLLWRPREKCGILWKMTWLHNVDNIRQKEIKYIIYLHNKKTGSNELLENVYQWYFYGSWIWVSDSQKKNVIRRPCRWSIWSRPVFMANLTSYKWRLRGTIDRWRVFRIRDVLIRIRIPGSVLLPAGLRSCSFLQWLSRCQQK